MQAKIPIVDLIVVATTNDLLHGRSEQYCLDGKGLALVGSIDHQAAGGDVLNHVDGTLTCSYCAVYDPLTSTSGG